MTGKEITVNALDRLIFLLLGMSLGSIVCWVLVSKFGGICT